MTEVPAILTAEQARVLAAGVTTHELLLVLSQMIGDAARGGASSLFVGENVVRGAADWSGGREGVIGEATEALRRQGYIVRKSMDHEARPCLRIDWKAEPAGNSGGYWDK